MTARVDVKGRIGVSEATVLTILDEEARESTRDATKLLRAAVEAEAPVGSPADGDIHPGLLAKSHKQSVTRTPYGVRGTLKRRPEAWYGRIVEKGRKAGRGRTGRRVGAQAPNAFIDRAAAKVEPAAQALLEQGSEKAARRIQRRLDSR